MRKLFVLAIVVILSVSGLSTASATEPSTPPAALNTTDARSVVVPRAVARLAPTTYERRVIRRTNNRRANRDLARVREKRCVDRFANGWARHMASTRRMVHQDLRPILHRCGLRMVGENIAYGFPGAFAVVRAWMHSPGHRANLLRRQYRLIGVGAARDRNGVMWVSQVFGRR